MKLIKRFLMLPLVISFLICAVFPLMLTTSSKQNEVSEISETSSNTIIEGVNNTEDIDISLPSYKQNNPLWPKFNGQCTWFAWSRANQLFGVRLPARNAKLWYELAKDMGFKVGHDPSKNAIMVQSGIYGHVAFVEGWDGENITLSEGNVNWHGYAPEDGVGVWANDEMALAHIRVSTSNYTSLCNRLLANGRYIIGYIYLE